MAAPMADWMVAQTAERKADVLGRYSVACLAVHSVELWALMLAASTAGWLGRSSVDWSVECLVG